MNLDHWHCECCGRMVVPGTEPLIGLRPIATDPEAEAPPVVMVPARLGCVRVSEEGAQPPIFRCGGCHQIATAPPPPPQGFLARLGAAVFRPPGWERVVTAQKE